MKRIVTVIIAITCNVYPMMCNHAVAWNAKGHVAIAEMAYQNLPANVKEEVDRLIDPIFAERVSEDLQEQIKEYYPTASKFAVLSIAPDILKKLTAEEFFEKFGATLPESFKAYGNEVTIGWHYITRAYPAREGCKTVKLPNVIWAINNLKEAFNNVQDERTKAVLLILQSHFIADIHMPLHTFSYVDEGCVGDRGGNEFIIDGKENGEVKNNLHALWDSAMFYFSRERTVSTTVEELGVFYPRGYFSKEAIGSRNPSDWADENYRYARFVYSIQPKAGLPKSYEEEARKVGQKRAALAGYRLSEVMKEHFKLCGFGD